MNALKKTTIISLSLLTACAPPRPRGDVTPSYPAPLTQSSKPTESAGVETTTTEPAGVKNISNASGTKAESISSWVISGAMAAKGPKKSWSASVNWRQQGMSSYQIRLYGPLGGGTVIIERAGGTVTYKDGPKVASSGHADELLQRETGIRLPVNNLYYWVRGIPAPGGVQGVKYDQNHHITSLKQAGYVLNYDSYTNVNNVALPSRIRLHGHGVSIKLVVKRWSV